MIENIKAYNNSDEKFGSSTNEKLLTIFSNTNFKERMLVVTDKRVLLFQHQNENQLQGNFQSDLIDSKNIAKDQFEQNIRNYSALSAWPISNSQTLILADEY